MPTIPQNDELLKHLFQLIGKHRGIFKQERVYQRAVALVLAELFVFARHTITQLIMTLGMTEQDWSGWYRLFSHRRFNYDKASEILFRETLAHVDENGLYVVGSDATQTPRSSCKLILIVVRGKKRQNKHGHTYRRDPLPFLVNAVQDGKGRWVLPLPVETLLFWAWQRWKLEVCHRKLKSNFGLGLLAFVVGGLPNVAIV